MLPQSGDVFAPPAGSAAVQSGGERLARRNVFHAGAVALHDARHGILSNQFGAGQPVLAIEVVFGITILTDLVWSARAALVALFVTLLAITVLSKVIRWRRNRYAEKLLSAALPRADGEEPTACFGDPADLVQLLPVRRDLPEPVVAIKGFLKLRGWRIVAWLVLMFVSSVYVALCQPIGSYWLSNAVSASLVLAMIPVAAARISPTYFRVVPGRLDILSYRFFSTKPKAVEKIPLRDAKVTARFDRSRLSISQPDESTKTIDMEGILDHHRFVRAVLCAATCNRPTPPVPDDTLYG